jgi:uncharacterized protein with FMN-binding domain
MKRALVVGTGTLAGLAAVLGLNPEPAQVAASASIVESPSTGTGGSGSTTPDATTPDATTPESTTPESTTPESTTPESSGQSAGSVTVTGPSIDVGRGYGEAQVEITVTDGRLVDITALAIPANDHHSESISRRAWPTLVEQALAAQSADIAGVSGATYTTFGFVESLRAALQEAGLS